MPETKYNVIRIGNYSNSYNSWFYIEVKDNNRNEFSIELPNKLNSAYKRATSLSQRINSGDNIKISCKILDNNALASISSYLYYPSRIEIKKINETVERIVAILFTTEDWHSNEREEFYQLYRKGYTKSELFQIFGREDINVEWENARIRAGKESVITGQNFSDFFYGIDSDYKDVHILYGASHKSQYGEKKVSNSKKPLSITEDETLFYNWEDFVEEYRKKFSNRDEKVEFNFNFTKGDAFYKFKFFSSNYDILNPSPRSNDEVSVHLRVEEYLDGKPTAYSFCFITQNDNEEQIDFFAKYGDAFIRYIMHLKDQVYKKSFKSYDTLREINKNSSIKTAVSAIMSRNMSHNLGSHYLYYTKVHLDDIASKAESLGPDIRGAAKVLGYIQGRMDYLATLISTDKYPYAPVNFESQLFDDLTIDSSSKRHFNSGEVNNRTTNFLLTNLILSENFTRPSISDDDEDSPFDMLQLQVKYKRDSTSSFETFTGTNNSNKNIFPSISSESGVKNALANLNIAMPGGTMSCHAFYNIIENFIRNSAKYRRGDFEKEVRYIYDPKIEDVRPDGKEHYNLNITIGIIKHQNGKYVDFVIYDNKANATYFKEERNDEAKNRCLLQILNDKLRSIKILTEDNTAIDKDSKGIKEMLFSAAWMRAYTFERSKTFADIISDIHANPDGEAKLELINEHCFSFVAVDDSNDNLTIYTEKELLNSNSEISNKSPLNLGVSFTMPVFLDTAVLEGTDSEQDIINESLSLYADVAISEKHLDFLSNVYTRYYCGSIQNMSDVDILHSVIAQRFKDIDKYRLVFGTNSDKDKDLVQDAYVIKFKDHMNSQEASNLYDNLKYAYADTVSGGNFTKTINELFDNGNPKKKSNGEDNFEYLTPQDEYFALKIKESALTRITLIDERLSNNAAKHGNTYALELQLKNLSILNYVEHSKIDSIFDLFGGIGFKDDKPFTHFLSIHLGIIEKILKCKEFNDYVDIKKPEEDKAKFLMREIKEVFGGKNTYITIHSGRGNFSKELEGSLDSYPFISLSSIESALNNCKFLLSQLFYSTRYVGKGRYNKK